MTNNTKTINIRQSLAIGVFGLFVLLGILLVKPGGIGGTGIGDGEGNGGIGGTGIGTGFVGRIDRFGSIWVNGSEIFYSEDIPVRFNGRAGLLSDIKVGHVVQLVARPDKNGALFATSLDIRYEVVGEVKSLAQNTATVFTDTVVFPLDRDTKLALGDKVAVSGFRRSDGIIMASRIDMISDDQPSKTHELLRPFAGQVEALSLSGYVRWETDGYSLYGYRISNGAETFSPHSFIKVTAKTESNTLQDVTIHQMATPKMPQPSMPKPKIVPQDAPIQNRLQSPIPLSKQEVPEKPAVTPPNKPQPIRRQTPTIDKPEIRPSPIVPIQPVERQDAQTPSRPLDEPENQLPDPLPQQRETEGLRQPDPEPDEPSPDPELREQSADEPDMVERTEEPDIPERGAVTPERDSRPEPPTRPERTERTDRPERADRPVRPQRPERPERPERPDRPR